ncbi:MAG: MBOAT family protein [Planctomycetes bacterium]|nr:MBOAT family protein [Planctomycetota bacterium]
MDVLSLKAAGFLAASVLLLCIPAPRTIRLGLLVIANLAFLALLHPLAPAVFGAVTLLAYAGARVAANAKGGTAKAAVGIFSILIGSLLFVPKLGIFPDGGGHGAPGAGFAANFAKSPAYFAGASYFTLRALQFMFDAKREGKVHFNILETLAWNGFFPTLLAGPIERSQHFTESLDTLGKPCAGDLIDGAWRIYIGLLKKVVLSQIFFTWAQPLVEFEHGVRPTHLEAWTSLYSFGLYFYFDFSGYSDLAIGAARFCGIRLAENFDNPYLRPNISEFWRTWHISLSSWIRDYVFLPMCGKSSSRWRPHAASVGSMVLCGLWHGPTFGWALWGVFHGVALSIHQQWTAWLRKHFRWKQKLTKSKIARAIAMIITFHFLAIAWTWTAYATTGVGTTWRFLLILFGIR